MTRPLTEKERACLTCPLADCLPDSPSCPQKIIDRRAKARQRRRRRK